jgi:hypothetical protein
VLEAANAPFDQISVTQQEIKLKCPQQIQSKLTLVLQSSFVFQKLLSVFLAMANYYT